MSDNHDAVTGEKSIKFGLVANTAFTIVAIICGLATGSLALIAMATDGLVDTFTLAITLAGNRLGRRRATDDKTFGYGRATILAALVNASIMVAVAISIGIEAVQRIGHPVTIEGGIVAIVAALGIIINGAIAYSLSKHRDDLSMRTAYIDNLLDVVAAIATLVTGLLVVFTHWYWLDTAVGLAIALLIIFNAYQILQEAAHILLEGTPDGFDIRKVKDLISETDGVIHVDDMHVWSIRSGYNALSCHIAIDKSDLLKSRDIVENAKKRLNDMGIQHATIEVELKSDAASRNHEHH